MEQNSTFVVHAGTHITNTSWIEIELHPSGDSLRYRICWGQEDPEIHETEILYMEDEDGETVGYFQEDNGTIRKLNQMIRV